MIQLSPTVIGEPDNNGCPLAPITYPLTINRTGNGAVTTSDGQMNCGQICTVNYGTGSSVTLLAAPEPGYTFAGWSGVCTGAQLSCTVTMDSAKSVNATFNALPTYTLSVGSTYGGIATTSDGRINCSKSGGTCSATYVQGTTVTLIANPGTGSFHMWTGACVSVDLTCTLTVNADVVTTASFKLPLTINVVGSSANRVRAFDAFGISTACSSNCTSNTVADMIILEALPASGYTFVGWSDACSGTNTTCTFYLDTAKSVTATFSAP